MKRREFEALLVTLESTAALLSRAAATLSPAEARRRPAAGGFSLVENVWHLADLEREGYAVRIRRILGETNPALLNFDGDRIARERGVPGTRRRPRHRGVRPGARAEPRSPREALARGVEALGLAGGRGLREPRRHPAHDGRARPRARGRDREPARRDPRSAAGLPALRDIRRRLTGEDPQAAEARRFLRHSSAAAMIPGRIERKITTRMTISMCSLTPGIWPRK